MGRGVEGLQREMEQGGDVMDGGNCEANRNRWRARGQPMSHSSERKSTEIRKPKPINRKE
jgi:hypothetical protein